MRTSRLWTAMALSLLIGSPAVWADKAFKFAEEETCSGEFGTSVTFEKSPSDAARKALNEEKLVCVLHISGHFEDPGLT